MSLSEIADDEQKKKTDGAALLRVDPSAAVQTEPLPTYSVGVTDESAAEIMDAFAELSCAMTAEDESKSITRVVAAVRADTLTIIDDAIQAKLTPDLNNGTAMDMTVIVGEVLREFRTIFGNATRPLSETSGSVPSAAQDSSSHSIPVPLLDQTVEQARKAIIDKTITALGNRIPALEIVNVIDLVARGLDAYASAIRHEEQKKVKLTVTGYYCPICVKDKLRVARCAEHPNDSIEIANLPVDSQQDVLKAVREERDIYRAIAERDSAEVATLTAERDALQRAALFCYVCGKPAACIGNYEAEDHYKPACDEHCGHGNEDGWCRPVAEALAEMSKWLLEANTADESASAKLATLQVEHETLKTLAAEFVCYWTTDRTPDGCGMCGGIPHSTTCYVGRMAAWLPSPPVRDAEPL